jgi:hypothetical protein
MDQKWQRLTPFEKLADMLLKHLEGILNYYQTKKVRYGWSRRSMGTLADQPRWRLSEPPLPAPEGEWPRGWQ